MTNRATELQKVNIEPKATDRWPMSFRGNMLSSPVWYSIPRNTGMRTPTRTQSRIILQLFHAYCVPAHSRTRTTDIAHGTKIAKPGMSKRLSFSLLERSACSGRWILWTKNNRENHCNTHRDDDVKTDPPFGVASHCTANYRTKCQNHTLHTAGYGCINGAMLEGG